MPIDSLLMLQAISIMTLLIGAIVVSYALLADTRIQNYSDESDGENSAEIGLYSNSVATIRC